jgi:shikimate dehydrogenase
MSLPFAEVIGDPIAHSKSPLIHGFWLEKLKLEAAYRAVHVKPEGLADYLASRRGDPLWRGCNVTLPHKIAVMDLVDDPGEVRGSIGAMNTLIHAPGGSITGTNTDAAGFLAPIMDVDLAGKPVIVAGSGGAAHAILFALKQAGAGPVTLLARNALKGAMLLARFGMKGEVKPLDSALPPAALLVNTSSLGMKGQPEFAPDLSPLPDEAIVYDIVYAPLETPLLQAAQAHGLETVDGLSMLIGQAAFAFELFFGAPPPEDCDEELRERLLA